MQSGQKFMYQASWRISSFSRQKIGAKMTNRKQRVLTWPCIAMQTTTKSFHKRQRIPAPMKAAERECTEAQTLIFVSCDEQNSSPARTKRQRILPSTDIHVAQANKCSTLRSSWFRRLLCCRVCHGRLVGLSDHCVLKQLAQVGGLLHQHLDGLLKEHFGWHDPRRLDREDEMVAHARQLHAIGPLGLSYALAAHGAVSRPGHACGRDSFEVLDVEHAHGALAQELLRIAAGHGLPEPNLRKKPVRGGRNRRPFRVRLSHALLAPTLEGDFLSWPQLRDQNVVVHGPNRLVLEACFLISLRDPLQCT
mmetsp:Transcript_29101/g.61154  ORF Transcript_29101/g.61154 Transcript_29101/m.61154 type:complete len:307 (-) Transcript_29101:564-1484(-)